MRIISLKRIAALFAVATTVLTSQAEIPMAYYGSLNGLCGAELKTAVHELVAKAPYIKMYKYGSGSGSSWDAFYVTDRVAETNAVIDRYSNETFYFGEQGESVSGMDIEHSFPKSYWGGTITNAYKDLYNLMPCESSINRCKSNYSMGLVDPTQNKPVAEANGLTKVGKGLTDPENEYWEPGDQWKGDFARGYMYMATAYQDYEWVLDQALLILQTGAYPTLRPEVAQLYIEWAKADPVAEIETVRVDRVMKIQGNRNPYVDFPNLMCYVWGDSVDVPFNVLTTVKSSKMVGSIYDEYVPDMPGYTPSEDDDSPLIPDGEGTEDSPYNVTQVIALNPQSTAVEAGDPNADRWVEGYIVGWLIAGKAYVNSETTSFEELDESPCDNATSIILGPQAYTSDYKQCILVQLPTGAVRTALNLKDTPDNHHKLVAVRGDITKYYNHPAVRNTDAYKFIEISDVPDPEDPSEDPEDPGEDPEDPIVDPVDPVVPGEPVVVFENTFLGDQAGFTVDNVILPEGLTAVWANNKTQGWIAAGFTGTAASPTERFATHADLVSPVFDLSAVENAQIKFDHGSYKAASADVQANLSIIVRVGEEETAIAPSQWPAGSNQNWVNEVTADLSHFDGQSAVQLVFRYTSTTDAAPNWKIRNFSLTGTAKAAEPAVVPGDANGDGAVSIVDAVLVVNYLLAPESTSINLTASDLNSDESISIVDVVAIINIILNQ